MNPAEINAHSLRFVQLTGAFAKRAIEEINDSQAAVKAASELIEPTIDMMKKANTLDESDIDQARAMLSKHASTTELLQEAVKKIAELQGQIDKQAAVELGVGETQKSASDSDYDSLTSPFVGQRTSQKKASDEALLSGLNIVS